MREKLTDAQLQELADWATPPERNSIMAMVLVAVAEIRERRAVDRTLVNARQKGVHYAGMRRRK